MKLRLCKVLGSIMGILAIPFVVTAQEKSQVPVIVIMADQLRYDVLGERTPQY